jgi:Glycosyl transferases group 1
MARHRTRLYMTRPFRDSQFSHGGHHRFQQIKELVVDAGLPVAGEIAARHRSELSRSEAIQTMTAALSRFPLAGFGCTPSLAGLFRIGAAELALRDLQRSDVLLWAPSYGAHLALGRLARRKGIRVIALIHNIESLVPNQPCPIRSSRSDWLDIELAHLANAEVIFCHSRWDQWFLCLRGLQARLLPYYPARSRQQSLCAIRTARLTGPIGDRVVVLGSAHNQPTRLGMIEQLRIIKQNWEQLREIEFHFCGDQTARLHDGELPPNVHLHGYVDEESLREHLVAAKAVWFHQPPTTGVLTRIVDMLVAGVPVVANSFAARSQETINGVSMYNLDAVPPFIQSSRAMPEMPGQPDLFAEDFLDTIFALTGETLTR